MKITKEYYDIIFKKQKKNTQMMYYLHFFFFEKITKREVLPWASILGTLGHCFQVMRVSVSSTLDILFT